MDYGFIRFIIFTAFVLGVLFFLLKSIVRAILVTIVIIFVFKVGWIYTPGDIKEKIPLRWFVNEDHAELLYNKYENYVDKREESSIIDVYEIEKDIREKGIDATKELDRKVDSYLRQRHKKDRSGRDGGKAEASGENYIKDKYMIKRLNN